ncbi:MAG TPA: aminotransferase class I/II-fold pyridoxal phosphate-dependent enzyme [Longimicrobiales bacterium]|nr:aminotransferase class I/II-fold pyridoxal phosphate-dependent enzyme [Longimicrobiales bacterium]
MPRTARRTHGFTESVIREMTRVANEAGALNLAQGFPDFPAPDVLKEAACAAIRADVNQYAVTWGAPRLRRALAAKYAQDYGMAVDEAAEVTVTCGATEAMAAALLAIVDPGDEVLIFEPFYENYGPDAILCGAVPVWLRLEPDAPLDLDRIAAAITVRTRAIILNTPNNPTGRVFSRAELEGIAALCVRHDLVAFTDEIYEHISYDAPHVPLATLAGMRERTVTISGYSKTFSITGWRIGTIIAPADLTGAIRKVHDFLTVGAPAPLQEACAVAIETLGPGYYTALADDYRARRDLLHGALVEAGFRCTAPAGAYYILADFSALADSDDVTYARWLARGGADPDSGPGVATVPGSSFFHRPEDGRHLVRFAFCKRLETLHAAGERLRRIARAPGPITAGMDLAPLAERRHGIPAPPP